MWCPGSGVVLVLVLIPNILPSYLLSYLGRLIFSARATSLYTNDALNLIITFGKNILYNFKTNSVVSTYTFYMASYICDDVA